jgi:hypothetical protein
MYLVKRLLSNSCRKVFNRGFMQIYPGTFGRSALKSLFIRGNLRIDQQAVNAPEARARMN